MIVLLYIKNQVNKQMIHRNEVSQLPSDDYYETMLEYKSKRKSLEFQGLFDFSTMIAHS